MVTECDHFPLIVFEDIFLFILLFFILASVTVFSKPPESKVSFGSIQKTKVALSYTWTS